ncbi:MAG TPA: protein kinase [Candidatus Binatia bacterium]|jgi:serine/threonine protein kinase
MAEKIGKYEIAEQIGRGGMGWVYKAWDPFGKRFVAIKVISPDGEVNDEMRARFRTEIEAGCKLEHPNIVRIYEVGQEGERVYIVMELLEGQELKGLISQRVELDLEDHLSVMVQLCGGLFYAHNKGIIHRDIKPGNVIVEKDGNTPKLIDFGIAKMAQSSSATRTGFLMGTPKYMSPEQCRGQTSALSDQYSLAVIFYEMLAFRPPFVEDDLIPLLHQISFERPPALLSLNPAVPEALAQIIEKAMSKNPAERYQDLGWMKGELEDLQLRVRYEANQLRDKLKPLTRELNELESAFARRIGTNSSQAASLTPRSVRLETLRKLDDEIVEKLAHLRQQLKRADALEPQVHAAEAMLRDGRTAEVIAACNAVLEQVPEHLLVQGLLKRAKDIEQTRRKQQLARDLIDDARAALDEGDAPLCLSILEQAEEIPPPEDLRSLVNALRATASERIKSAIEQEKRAAAAREAEKQRLDEEAREAERKRFEAEAREIALRQRAQQDERDADQRRREADAAERAKDAGRQPGPSTAVGSNDKTVVQPATIRSEVETRPRPTGPAPLTIAIIAAAALVVGVMAVLVMRVASRNSTVEATKETQKIDAAASAQANADAAR